MLSAARLFRERGVTATSVDEILAAAEAGKGQFYRYFDSKETLVAAVVARQIDQYLGGQLKRLERLERLEELEAYLSGLVADHERRDLVGGCPVGSLALELAGHDDALRRPLAEALAGWQASLAAGLRRLADRGSVRADVDPERLAASLLASIQGAYLLSTVHRESGVMAQALDQTLAYLRSPSPAPGDQPTDDGTV